MKRVLMAALLRSSTIFYLVLSQPCELVLPNQMELGELVVQLTYEEAYPGPVTVIQNSIQYTCLVEGVTQGTYRSASVIVSYRVDPGNDVKVGQFQFYCLKNHWIPILNEGLVSPPLDYVSLETDYNCSNCSRTADNHHNCISKTSRP